MQKLPERQASAIRLIYTHELSYAAAAGWLGIAISELEGWSPTGYSASRRACFEASDMAATAKTARWQTRFCSNALAGDGDDRRPECIDRRVA